MDIVEWDDDDPRAFNTLAGHPANDLDDLDREDDDDDDVVDAQVGDEAEDAHVDDQDNEEDETDSQSQATVPKHPFPHLREMGHLASWTVSSHKQRCGVQELRSPSINDFWQSDGPQPHILTIHFFKRVTICHMRLHVDHDLDESYTPTRIQIWAGTAHHDLQLVKDMPLEAPKGWLDIDLSSAGGPSEFVDGEEVDHQAVVDSLGFEPSENIEQVMQRRRRKLMVGRGPTLRCFIVQVRVLENHQNGKDTHLRGFQVFSKDHEAISRHRATIPLRTIPTENQKPHPEASGNMPAVSKKKTRRQSVTVAGIREADWMGEMTIR